jgi:hypothetical protein
VPAIPAADQGMTRLSWIDSDNFNPNYLQRSMHKMPKRGDRQIWQHTQDYWREKEEIPKIDLEGQEFQYHRDNQADEGAGQK